MVQPSIFVSTLSSCFVKHMSFLTVQRVLDSMFHQYPYENLKIFLLHFQKSLVYKEEFISMIQGESEFLLSFSALNI